MSEPTSNSIADQFAELVSAKFPGASIGSQQSVPDPAQHGIELGAPESRAPSQRLSAALETKGYHPVLIFGTRASGKSTLLTALFSYFQSDPESQATCILGDWIIPTDTTVGAQLADEASRFFNRVVSEFHSGNAAPSTQFELPFFIPVVVHPSNGSPVVKLAILESKGEFYQVNPDSARYFPELREEITDIYQNYNGAISVIIVAPYVMSEAYTSTEGEPTALGDEFKLADDALLASLQSYLKHRQHPELDRFNFILTKWDVHTKGINTPTFYNPPGGLVESLVSKRFPKAFTVFQNFSDSKGDRLSLMPFSAGVISGNDALPTPQKFRPIMHRFPNRLWNWLYMGAANGKPLYEKSSAGRSKSFFAKLLGLIT
jgi:hypothetical protein